jgi:small GTP-binding protein
MTDDDLFDQSCKEKTPDFDKNLNIVLVGKVSAGKSSLINAILEKDRDDPKILPVGSISGITTKVTAYPLGKSKDVLIIDCPGLDDVRKENSEETKKFLAEIDLGLFVITGSADATQKKNYEDLKNHCKKTIVVLNKIDEWDDLEKSEYEDVMRQWETVLGADKLFGTCTKGFNPKMRKDAPMDLRGVDELRKEIMDFLKTEGKDILLAKHLTHKGKYAIGIITTALAAVAAEAFIPGSAIYISATQVAAISTLSYLYTGEAVNKSNALSLIAAFAGESIGMNAFLWAKSLLPPTGIVDIAAAGVAVTVTFAMLATVKWLLENNLKLESSPELTNTYGHFRTIGKEIGEALKNMSLDDFRSKDTIVNLVTRLLAATWKP